jgi:hypothetical protein
MLYSQILFERLNTEKDIPEEYIDPFIADFNEWGPEVAIYNLGFLMGWDDRNSKDENE